MEDNKKIIHKRFQLDYSDGSIEVQLNFIIAKDVIEISNIQIHGTFDSSLPNSPKIEQINSKSFLVSEYTNIHGKTISTRIVGNDYGNDILEEISRLKIEIAKK